jgi:hypothetical protein
MISAAMLRLGHQGVRTCLAGVGHVVSCPVGIGITLEVEWVGYWQRYPEQRLGQSGDDASTSFDDVGRMAGHEIFVTKVATSGKQTTWDDRTPLCAPGTQAATFSTAKGKNRLAPPRQLSDRPP